MHITMKQSVLTLIVTAVVFYEAQVIFKRNEEISFLKNALEKERRINYESEKYSTTETKNLFCIVDTGVGIVLSVIMAFIIFEFSKQEREESAEGISEIYFDTEMALVKGLSALQLEEKEVITSGTLDSGLESIREESLLVEMNTNPLMKIPPEKINHVSMKCTEAHPFEEYIQCYAIGK